MKATVTDRVKRMVSEMDTEDLINFVHEQECLHDKPYNRSEIIAFCENWLVEYHYN